LRTIAWGEGRSRKDAKRPSPTGMLGEPSQPFDFKGSNCIPKATDFSFFFAVLLLLESVALPGFLGG